MWPRSPQPYLGDASRRNAAGRINDSRQIRLATLSRSWRHQARIHGSLRTQRWREMDSNHRSLSRGSRFILRKVNCGGIDGAAKKFCGYRWFESVSLQRGVDCEPDFRGRILSMTVGPFFFL